MIWKPKAGLEQFAPSESPKGVSMHVKKMQLKHNLHFYVCVDVCSCFGEIIDSFFSLSWHVYSLVFRANCLFFLYLRISRANIMLSTLYCNVKLVLPNIVLTARLNYNKKLKKTTYTCRRWLLFIY